MKDTQFANQAKQTNEMQSHMALAGLQPVVSGQDVKGEAWTESDMQKCLNDIYDLGEKCGFRFIALGDLARACRDRKDVGFNAKKIELAMNKRQLVPEIESLFKTWGFEKTDYGYKYYFTPPIKWDVHIPVEIRVLDRKYKFFDNPDLLWFGVNDFVVANPFESYWKARHLIQ